jgi:hypothetical protein
MGLLAEIRSLEGTPNYGPRHLETTVSHEPCLPEAGHGTSPTNQPLLYEHKGKEFSTVHFLPEAIRSGSS